MSFETLPQDIRILLAQLDVIADKSTNKNFIPSIYELDYENLFPQYVEHDVSSEILLERFYRNATQGLEHQKKLNLDNFLLEELDDFNYFLWKSIDDTEGYYALLHRIYCGMYTLHHYMHRCIRLYHSPRFYFQTPPESPTITGKRVNLHFRIDWCVFYIKRMYNKLQTEIYLNQIIVWDKIKTTVDETGSKVIKYNSKIKKYYLSNEKRTLWCWDFIAENVMSYLMDLHPMNDDCTIKKVKRM